MDVLWLDTETYSEADLKRVGTHAYAEHPSTEITVVQWALNDAEPVVVDMTGPDWMFGEEAKEMLDDPGIIIAAHNAVFDRTLIRHCWGLDIPPERWYCTMAQALSHGLPGGLDKIAVAMGLPLDDHKDKRGRELVQLFCKPRPKNMKLRRATRETHPKEWSEFLEYSRQDIVAMRAASKRMPRWNYDVGKPEWRLWCLDQRINDRGFALDLELARAAIDVAERAKQDIRDEVSETTDGDLATVTKRDALFGYLAATYGVTMPDLKSDTIRRRMEDPELPAGFRQLLALRLEATRTSTSKYKTMVLAASPDGRIRNTMQFAGAQRTARWAGRLVQPQNQPRTPPWFDGAMQAFTIDRIKDGTVDGYMAPMQALSYAIRGAIIAPPRRKLVIADLSNIEGRKLVWLAGEDWKLQSFREFDAGIGPDLYIAAYARAFGVSQADARKGRQIGKVMELGLGYEGGVGAFLTFAAVYNMDLDVMAEAVWATADGAALREAAGVLEWVKKTHRTTFGLSDRVYIACEVLKASWRRAHPATVEFWGNAKDAVLASIRNKGVPFDAGPHIRVQTDKAWTRVRLPSGRCLCYLDVSTAHDTEHGSGLSYLGVSPYTHRWGRVYTYGGKLAENWTQASARDVLAASMPDAEEAGYETVLTVHDELVTETPDMDDFTVDALTGMMTRSRAQFAGLPLAAAGFETRRYRKD